MSEYIWIVYEEYENEYTEYETIAAFSSAQAAMGPIPNASGNTAQQPAIQIRTKYPIGAGAWTRGYSG